MSKANPAGRPNSKKSPPKSNNGSSNTVQLTGDAADRSKLVAQCVLAPSLQAAATVQRWSKALGELDIQPLIEELRQQAATASSGDLKRQEAMLTIQAHTLDAIFNELARRSAANIGEYIGAAEVYMRLALKAQSQCRTTIETLAEIKNPKPVAFVQQANIANGPQQVNNGSQVPAELARAGNSENQQSKLLEQSDGQRLELGAKGATGAPDTALEAVGAVDRAENDGR